MKFNDDPTGGLFIIDEETQRQIDEIQRASDEAMKELLSINDEQLAGLRAEVVKQARQLGRLSLAEKPPFSLSN